MNSELPKQFLTLAGVSLLARSVRTLCEVADEVVVVMHADYVDLAREQLQAEGLQARVVAGGATRSASTRCALASIAALEGRVIIHDVARPLVARATFEASLAELDSCEAVTVAQPVTDTIARFDGEHVVGYVERSELLRVQTPQAFSVALLRRAHESAGEFTDDCQAVSAYDPGIAVHIVPGAERNVKITGPADLVMAESLLASLDEDSG
jgi:2-C-methyl-D-erythritol 4-phosphate cytidylyltransferase